MSEIDAPADDATSGAEGEQSIRDRIWAVASASDIRLIAVTLLAIYAIFLFLGIVGGLDVNGLYSSLERVTFFAAVYALVVLALNLQWGYAGLFNIGVAGFMAIGLYSMHILTVQIGLPYPVGALVAILITSLFGALVALPALRLRADYLAIVTLAFAEIVRSILGSQRFAELSLGGVDIGFGGATGPDGVLPDPVKFILYEDPYSLRPESNAFGELYFSLFDPFVIDDSTAEGILYALFLIVFVGLFYFLLVRTGNSPFGRVLKAIREDETVANALGKDTRKFKIKAFALGSALMGLAAILWYTKRGGVTPTNFEPEITFFIFVALIIGGAGSNTGSVIGGIVFGALLFRGPVFVERIINRRLEADADPTTIFDAFTGIDPFIVYTTDNLSALRVVLLGVVLIILIQRRPEGLLGNRKEIASSIDLEDRTGGEN